MASINFGVGRFVAAGGANGETSAAVFLGDNDMAGARNGEPASRFCLGVPFGGFGDTAGDPDGDAGGKAPAVAAPSDASEG